MVDLSKIKNIYLYPNGISFRIGLPGLTSIILNEYDESEIKDCLFIFFGRDKRQVKMLKIESCGIWLYQYRLKEGNFVLPTLNDGKMQIDKKQLLQILTIIKYRKK